MSEFSEAFLAVMDYVEAHGGGGLNSIEGCWESAVDEHWWIALNGHPEPTKCSPGFKVDPFCCYIFFNGWPAGQINAFGGWVIATEGCNEDSFIDTLKAATVKI